MERRVAAQRVRSSRPQTRAAAARRGGGGGGRPGGGGGAGGGGRARRRRAAEGGGEVDAAEVDARRAVGRAAVGVLAALALEMRREERARLVGGDVVGARPVLPHVRLGVGVELLRRPPLLEALLRAVAHRVVAQEAEAAVVQRRRDGGDRRAIVSRLIADSTKMSVAMCAPIGELEPASPVKVARRHRDPTRRVQRRVPRVLAAQPDRHLRIVDAKRREFW